MKRLTLAVAAAFAVAACGSGPDPLTAPDVTPTTAGATPSTTAGSTTSPTVVTTTSTLGGAPVSTQPPRDLELPVIEPARVDLAKRLGVDPGTIEVVSAERVTWPDGSLGCPQEGVLYPQVLVDGSRVVLGHEGRVYDYRAGADGQPILCPSPEQDEGYDFVPPPGFDE